MWRPDTLQDHLDGGDAAPPELSIREKDGKAACPSCGTWVRPHRITDCRLLTHLAVDWACDGCWTRWQREGTTVDDQPDTDDESEWLERWMQAHGAPSDALDHVRGKPRRPIGRLRRN